MKYFITGTAGFIGFHLARRLLVDGHEVVGFDGMTSYYDVALKRQRHAILKDMPGFSAVEGMLEDKPLLDATIGALAPDIMVHLAAQAGVRYSIDFPQTYVDSNLTGTFNVLEAARAAKPKHLLIASTSSVYGGNQSVPFRETDMADHPVSFYAATKKANEAMSHSYAHLYDIATTCLRFFTVYGPWGRPDMALFKFVSAVEMGKAIDIYGHGAMRRDFTYIDDLIESVVRLTGTAPEKGKPLVVDGVSDSLSPVAPWRVVNVTGGRPIELMDFVGAIEVALGREAIKTMLPMQAGDPLETYGDASLLRALTGYVPQTSMASGVGEFVDWYRQVYRSA